MNGGGTNEGGMSVQMRFRKALLDPEAATPEEITSWNGSDPVQRFSVYRNNVTVSLIEALGAIYPVVKALVGEDFFRDCARVFLRDNPPKSPVMAGYGAAFPAFLRDFSPAAPLPYLSDVARLEDARRRAYHAKDASFLGADDFASIDGAVLPDLSVGVHPSAVVLGSQFAIVSLWAAHQGHGAIENVDPYAPEEALVIRPAFEVDILRLPPGGVSFFTALAAGKTLGEAASHFDTAGIRFLPDLMNILVTSGFVTACTLQKETMS